MTSYEEVMKDCVCSQAFSRLCHSYWNKSSFRVLRDVLKDDESDLLCLTLNPDNISRFADRGPQARTPEVEPWLALWGNKSELRRYKDGSIQYTNSRHERVC